MAAGYIYILENKAYGPFVVKIGFSKRAPDIRAREIYSGATGVPQPFDIAMALSVADCKAAEKRIHKRLAAYRLSNRREFFRISPKVAAMVARESCAQVNQELGTAPPQELSFPPASQDAAAHGSVLDSELEHREEGRPVETVSIRSLVDSPVGTCTMTPEQLDRAYILHLNLSAVTGIAEGRWLESFSRDTDPERELRIWENIAKAFLRIDGIDIASAGLKKEAYSLLLSRSLSSTEDVLDESSLEHMSRSSAKWVLDGYRLKPKPILVRRR